MERYRTLSPGEDRSLFDASAGPTVLPEVLATVRPLTPAYCRQLWDAYVGYPVDHPARFMTAAAWPGADAWVARAVRSPTAEFRWHEDYNAGRPDPVASELRAHLPWPDDAAVYFFWSAGRGVETRWVVFRRHWINFLWDDEFPVLLAPAYPQVVVFTPTGDVCVGRRHFGRAGGWPVVAFDLDGTLGTFGTPGALLAAGRGTAGFRLRRGCGGLLLDLRRRYKLVLRATASRREVEAALDGGLRSFFERTYAADDRPEPNDDAWRREVDWTIDTDGSMYGHGVAAVGVVADRHLVVTACGSPEDDADPLAWAERVRAVLPAGAQHEETEDV